MENYEIIDEKKDWKLLKKDSKFFISYKKTIVLGSMNDKGDVKGFFNQFVNENAKNIIDVFHFIELSCTLEILIEQMKKIPEYNIERYDKLGNIEENTMFGFKLRVKKHHNNLTCYIKQKLKETIRNI